MTKIPPVTLSPVGCQKLTNLLNVQRRFFPTNCSTRVVKVYEFVSDTHHNTKVTNQRKFICVFLTNNYRNFFPLLIFLIILNILKYLSNLHVAIQIQILFLEHL